MRVLQKPQSRESLDRCITQLADDEATALSESHSYRQLYLLVLAKLHAVIRERDALRAARLSLLRRTA